MLITVHLQNIDSHISCTKSEGAKLINTLVESNIYFKIVDYKEYKNTKADLDYIPYRGVKYMISTKELK